MNCLVVLVTCTRNPKTSPPLGVAARQAEWVFGRAQPTPAPPGAYPSKEGIQLDSELRFS